MILSKKQQSFVELAKRVSVYSDCTHKHGCVLVKNGKVINTAFNQNTFSSFADRFIKKEWYGTRHAEISVVLGISRSNTTGSTIYVVRANRWGVFRNSKPCTMCEDTLRFVGIKHIIYSIDNDFQEIFL